MTLQDLAALMLSIALGAGGGAAVAGAAGALVGGAVGAGYGWLVNRLMVRAVVAVAAFAGAVVGVVVGRNVVRVLCLPGSCPASEIPAALLLGVGAFVGVALVAALVARSFDEFREGARSSDEDEAPTG